MDGPRQGRRPTVLCIEVQHEMSHMVDQRGSTGLSIAMHVQLGMTDWILVLVLLLYVWFPFGDSSLA